MTKFEVIHRRTDNTGTTATEHLIDGNLLPKPFEFVGVQDLGRGLHQVTVSFYATDYSNRVEQATAPEPVSPKYEYFGPDRDGDYFRRALGEDRFALFKMNGARVWNRPGWTSDDVFGEFKAERCEFADLPAVAREAA